jgi:hypothetical protein
MCEASLWIWSVQIQPFLLRTQLTPEGRAQRAGGTAGAGEQAGVVVSSEFTSLASRRALPLLVPSMQTVQLHKLWHRT